ncbi:MAG: cytochrome c [Pirellulaceae bacterium]|nr:MAG: cytochrome c [Pirellulaceae bacterium]
MAFTMGKKRLLCWIATTWLIAVSGVAAEEQATSQRGSELFRSTIAPLFEQRCIECHNDRRRAGGLSLQTRQALLAGGTSGQVVAPGEPDASYLIDMVSPLGGEPARMPKKGPALREEELEALRQWIAAGAFWPDGTRLGPDETEWWSLRPLRSPAVPAIADADREWVRTPIDAFVAAELRRRGLEPSPPADRRTLIRRLYFDLLGLPPPPEEVEAFLADPDPLAYERLVERLLASPHYGERWARHWLDVVHYADTHGYDKDKPRPYAWPYRDYVIRAWNEDKPYGRFIQEQIAGDVLYPDSPDGIVALGMLAAGPWDFISHVEVPEEKIDGRLARSLDRDDMVRTVMETFASTTIGCARCHDHKFDPFSQQDYYALQAVFAAIDRANRPFDPDPQVARKRRQLEQRVSELQGQIDNVLASGNPESASRLENIDNRIAEIVTGIVANLRPEYGYHSVIESTPDRTKWVQVDLGEVCEISSIVLAGCYDSYNQIGAGFGFPRGWRVEAALDADFTQQVVLIADVREEELPNPGIAPLRLEVSSVRARFVRVTATALAHRRNDYIFALAELMVLDANGRNIALGKPVAALDSLELPVRWAKKNLTDGIYPGSDASQEMQEKLVELWREKLAVWQERFSREQRQRLAQLRDELVKVRQQLSQLPAQQWVYAAATDFQPEANFKPTRGVPRVICLLERGNILSPRQEVQPAVPEVLRFVPCELPDDAQGNEGARRAMLARWLSHPAHPLTWRSIANRIWQYHFGQPLVGTPNDFGRQGARPTHPELLDWLAAELRDHGGSIKHLHRLICTSAVYRQASGDRAEATAVDKENRWLWRQNRRRLEAEVLRDAMLAVAGCLDLRMYGPGYQDFVIQKPEHSPHYEYHLFDPEDYPAYRRAVYRFIVRSQPQPFMTVWDCADPSMLVDKRGETITPLQALALWNGRLPLVAARRFAERLRNFPGDVRQRLQWAFQLALARQPSADEEKEFLEFARKFGWENVCRILLNGNEFLYVD